MNQEFVEKWSELAKNAQQPFQKLDGLDRPHKDRWQFYWVKRAPVTSLVPSSIQQIIHQ